MNTKQRILALPVDGRPVTREQVMQLANIADCELLCPDVEALGFFREPADRANLRDWIIAHAEHVDGFIFSIDMLVYGGLVPSRFISDSFKQLTPWLELLSELKVQYPEKPIYAFCATMRMSNNNENEEEKLYWAQYGELIWAWSYYSDRFTCLNEPRDNAEALKAKALIPDDIQDDYITTRQRNFKITQQVIELLEQGVIERLILPQDDTAEYGFNIAERRQLQALVAAKKLQQKILIYPGADEVIYTLLAHQLLQKKFIKQTKFALHVHHPEAFSNLIARYEDRLTYDSIACQIEAAGAQLVSNELDADVIIAVHCRGAKQGDWAMQLPLGEDLGISKDWLNELNKLQKPVALLDLAYANGGDPQLLEALPVGFKTLLAYAGWNTASNSIGSLVAQCCLAITEKNTPANQGLLATRLLDDYLYQANYRQQLRAIEANDASTEQLAILKSLYLDAANAWLQQHQFNDVTLDDIYQPWQRSFEIGLVMNSENSNE